MSSLGSCLPMSTKSHIGASRSAASLGSWNSLIHVELLTASWSGSASLAWLVTASCSTPLAMLASPYTVRLSILVLFFLAAFSLSVVR